MSPSIARTVLLVALSGLGVSAAWGQTERRIAPLPAAVAPQSEDDIGLVARFHFATHTPDFDRSRAFYRMLGYTEGVGGFPLTNTHQMARALGMFDLCQYELVKGEVISLPGSLNAANIDLLQFKTPFNGESPYELPNHLGMAYAALLTTDLSSDVEFLKSQGVDLLSEPYGIPGDQFVFFRDPDGVLYKLVETAPPHGDPSADMHLIAMPYIGINVSDLERSLAFYADLGYTRIKKFSRDPSTLEEARAYGLDAPFQVQGRRHLTGAWRPPRSAPRPVARAVRSRATISGSDQPHRHPAHRADGAGPRSHRAHPDVERSRVSLRDRAVLLRHRRRRVGDCPRHRSRRRLSSSSSAGSRSDLSSHSPKAARRSRSRCRRRERTGR